MNAIRITRCLDCRMYIAENIRGEGVCLEMSKAPMRILDCEVIPDWCELLQYKKCECKEDEEPISTRDEKGNVWDDYTRR